MCPCAIVSTHFSNNYYFTGIHFPFRKVILDPILSDVLFDKNFHEDIVTWDVLISRFVCETWFFH